MKESEENNKIKENNNKENNNKEKEFQKKEENKIKEENKNNKKDNKEKEKYKDKKRSRSRERRRYSRERSISHSPPRRSSRSSRRSRSRTRSRERAKYRKSRERTRSYSRSRSRSPTPEKPKRQRKSLWDQAPTGFEVGQIQLTAQIPPNPHQARQAKRLYIGNIPPGVNDQELADFFGNAMYQAGVTYNNNPQPIVAVQMNHEKNFAFIEFTVNEDATAGMAFDGITMKGYALKVRRPKDYKPLPEDTQKTPPSLPLALPNIVSTNVPEGPNKIFIGGLPSYLNEEQVKELLSTFGQLRSFNLVKDTTTGISKGFAFFDYVDPDVTDKACMGLNGMKVGEKNILVQRANIGAKSVHSPTETQSIINNPTAFNFLNLGMPIAAAVALVGLNINDSGPPTRIVQFLNMVSFEDLVNDEEYEDIMEDVYEECSKFGPVLSITIPRPPKPTVDEPYPKPNKIIWGVGRVYVEFMSKEDAFKAQQALGGKKFNNRVVVSGFFDERRYTSKDFIPDEYEERSCAERFRIKQEEQQRKQQEEEEKQKLLEDEEIKD